MHFGKTSELSLGAAKGGVKPTVYQAIKLAGEEVFEPSVFSIQSGLPHSGGQRNREPVLPVLIELV